MNSLEELNIVKDKVINYERLSQIKGGNGWVWCCETYIRGQQSASFCDPTGTGDCPPDDEDYTYKLVLCTECEV